jgi:hypothetical protein
MNKYPLFFESFFLKSLLSKEYLDSLEIQETGDLESKNLQCSNGSENRTDLRTEPPLPLSLFDVMVDLESVDSIEPGDRSPSQKFLFNMVLDDLMNSVWDKWDGWYVWFFSKKNE